MKRFLKCIILLCLIQSSGFSQTNARVEQNIGSGSGTGGTLDPVKPRADIIAHSPEVEAMAKYGVLPVTLFTGLPQISVPIFEIKASGLTIPFSFSFNYNGFKPTETASWLGLGWSLQGSGSIAKIIKGQPDNTMNSGKNYDDFVKMDVLSWKQNLMQQIVIDEVDAQPDIYVFNVGGYSGKFILIKGQAYLFPFQNLKISKIGTGFKMIDDNGNTYLFNDTETTFTKSAVIPSHISAWQISKIITADKKDTIKYFYTPYTFKQPSTLTDRYNVNSKDAVTNTNSTGHTLSRNWVDGDHVDALALASVSSRYGSLTFVGSNDVRLDMPTGTGKVLDKIVVNGPMGSTYQKEVVLVHDYYASNSRLKLKETFERRFVNDGSNLVPVIDQHYLFDYQGESVNLNNASIDGIDLWGYYNGSSNAMLFPKDVGAMDYFASYADRSPSSSYSSYGMLKKITYPTGGYSNFDFEQNKKGNYAVTYSYVTTPLTTQVLYSSTNQVNNVTEKRKSFTIDKPQLVSITYGDTDDFHIPTQSIVKIYNGSQLIYSSPLGTSADGGEVLQDAVYLIAGDYIFSVSCESTLTGTDILTYTTSGTITYDKKVAQVSSTLEDGPGLRIKTITSYDNWNPGTPAFVKQYSYNNGKDNSKGAFTPNTLFHQCAAYYDYSILASVKSALSDLSETQFYYGEVTETTQDATKTGKTVSTFGTSSAQLLDVKLLTATEYKYENNIFVPVKSNTNTYQRVEKYSFVGYNPTKIEALLPVPANTLGCVPLASPDITQAALLNDIYGITADNIYALIGDYSILTNSKEYVYSNDGTTSQLNQSDYSYESVNHIYPTRIVTMKSNGEQIIEQMKYPFDYNFGSCTLPAQIESNFQNDLVAAQTASNNNYSSLITALTPYQAYIDQSTVNQTNFANIASGYNPQGIFQSGVSTAITNRDNATSTYEGCLNSTVTNNSTDWQKAVAWMQLYNVQSPVIEKYTSIKKADNNEYLLQATRNEFSIMNSQAVEQVAVKQTEIITNILKTSFLTNPETYYLTQLNFTYDKDLNLVGQQKKNDMAVTYLYGYGQVYPIAEIKNASYVNVLTALGLTEAQYKAESSASVPSVNYLTKLNALRQNLPGALVTTYTFNPLIGMTSATDPNNKTTYYEHDVEGRLINVKDSNNNFTKAYEYHYKQ